MPPNKAKQFVAFGHWTQRCALRFCLRRYAAILRRCHTIGVVDLTAHPKLQGVPAWELNN